MPSNKPPQDQTDSLPVRAPFLLTCQAAERVVAERYRHINARKNFELAKYEDSAIPLSAGFKLIPLAQLAVREKSILASKMANEFRTEDSSDFFNYFAMTNDPQSISESPAISNNEAFFARHWVRSLAECPTQRINTITASMSHHLRNESCQQSTKSATSNTVAPHHYAVVTNAGSFVGLLGLFRDDASIKDARQLAVPESVLPNDAIMMSKFVVSQFRGQGVAGLMHAFVLQATQGRPLRSLVKTTNTANQKALAKANFEQVGETMPQVGYHAAYHVFRPRGSR